MTLLTAEQRQAYRWAQSYVDALRDTRAELMQIEFLREHHFRSRQGDLHFCVVCGPLKVGFHEGDPHHTWTEQQWQDAATADFMREVE